MDGNKHPSNWINVFVLDEETHFLSQLFSLGWGLNSQPAVDNFIKEKTKNTYCLGWYYCYDYFTASYKVQDYHIWKEIGFLDWWHGRVWVFPNAKGSVDLLLIQIHRTMIPVHDFGWYEDAEQKLAGDLRSIIGENGRNSLYHVAEEIPMPGNYGNTPLPDNSYLVNNEIEDYQSYFALYVTPQVISGSNPI